MAEYTETYLNVIQRWAAKCGLQYSDLLTTESDLFEQFANNRLKMIWDTANWPEVTEIYTATLDSTQKFEVTTSMMLILGVFKYDPFATFDSRNVEYRFRLKQGYCWVYGASLPDDVYVLYKERYPEFDGTADTIPMRFAEYVAHGAYADWLRAEQDPRAQAEDQFAQILLDHELDKYERQEKQGGSVTSIQTYTSPNY